MKKLLITLFLALATCGLRAHDHIETRIDPGNSSRLALVGNPTQTATYFPPGELPSLDLFAFPGGAFACLLTFSAFDNYTPPPAGALVKIELLSVAGPAGGSFSFWEVGAGSPTFTRAVGWSASGGNQPSFFASEDNTGYGHIHGRVFTMDRAGTYTVTFRAVDTKSGSPYAASQNYVVQITAINPPQLAISKNGSSIDLSFTSRPNLIYDLQFSTSLSSSSWTTIETLDGTGGTLQTSDAIAGRTRVFYRLVEYE